MNDLRFALRMLLKSPSFTAVAVLTLALGIGANSAIFSVIDTVLLRSLRFPQADRLTMIWAKSPQHPGEDRQVSNRFRSWSARLCRSRVSIPRSSLSLPPWRSSSPRSGSTE